MDWWVLVFSAIAAVAGVAGVVVAVAQWWWGRAPSVAEIDFKVESDWATAVFTAVGDLALHHPRVEVVHEGRAITTRRESKILRAGDEPIMVRFRSTSPDGPIGTTASIQWTELRTRRPVVRGSRVTFGQVGLDQWRHGRWKAIRRRRLRAFRGGFSNL